MDSKTNFLTNVFFSCLKRERNLLNPTRIDSGLTNRKHLGWDKVPIFFQCLKDSNPLVSQSQHLISRPILIWGNYTIFPYEANFNLNLHRFDFLPFIGFSQTQVWEQIFKLQHAFVRSKSKTEAEFIWSLSPYILNWSQKHSAFSSLKIPKQRDVWNEVFLSNMNSGFPSKNFEQVNSILLEKNAFCDRFLLKSLYKWALRRHPKNSRLYIRNKYFPKVNGSVFLFSLLQNCSLTQGFSILTLPKHHDFSHRKHKMIYFEKSPYDGDYWYWADRLSKSSVFYFPTEN
jgi:hypothetical protein